jgi:hypothetical protein
MKIGFRKYRTSRYREPATAARPAGLSFYPQATVERPDIHP